MTTLQPDNEAVATMPTFRRALSPNELAYFLPSRAYGLNDLFKRMTVRAPTGLITPVRAHLVWAILRLRHPLMASRVEMLPGCYDDAEFAYTPPSSPSDALHEASAYVWMYNDISATEAVDDFLNGPRKLSAQCLSRLEIVRQEQCAPGMHEFSLIFMLHHMIVDSLGAYATIQSALELFGGSEKPGGNPRTDAELTRILDREWMKRWDVPRDAHNVIVPATESRILRLPRSKFYEAASRVDHENIQKRFIGGQVLPRTKAPKIHTRLIQAKFSKTQSAAIAAKCKAKGVTLQNAVFGLVNLAWVRLCAQHPEIKAPPDLPMLMYTAVSLKGYLPSNPRLSSFVSLALSYHNVVLPSFAHQGVDGKVDLPAVLWTRARTAQKQMFAYCHSPLLLSRALAAGTERAERSKAWAVIDDEVAARGASTPASTSAPPRAPAEKPRAFPSLALIGVSQAGNTAKIFRGERYPAIELRDLYGGTRKGPGGILVYTRTFVDRFNMFLLWDAAPFVPGMVEELWSYVVDGVHEYLLEEPGLRGTAEMIDCAARTGARGKGKL